MDMRSLVNRNHRRKVYDWLTFVGDAVFPPVCLLCAAAGTKGRDLCGACLLELPRNEPACWRCGAPLTALGGEPCGQCQRHAPAFTATVAPYLYRWPMNKLVQTLKFSQGLAEGRLLGVLLAAAVSAAEKPDVIVPMPLHPERLRERGFNQAMEIARPVSRSLGIPLSTNILHRVLQTAPQTELKGSARVANVRGAFQATARRTPPRVALIDDVITTGATVDEAARSLRRAGAREVTIWAVARTPR